jgi:hypothetical protein
MTDPKIVTFLSDGPIDGMETFLNSERLEFAHWLPNGESHLIRPKMIYIKDEKKVYVFCPKHNEYVDVTAPSLSRSSAGRVK